MTSGGFLVWFFIFILIVIIVALIAVIGAVSGAVAGIVDDEDTLEVFHHVLSLAIFIFLMWP